MERAVEELRAARVAGHVVFSDAEKLQLYALLQQATVGDCFTSAPSALRPAAYAKWSNWYKLMGTQQSDAKRRYVELVKTLLPRYEEKAADGATVEEHIAGETLRHQRKAAGRRLELLLGGQVVLWVTLFVAMSVVLLRGRHFAADKLVDNKTQFGKGGHMLSPLMWFAVGYCLVILLRSKSFPWPVDLWPVAPLVQSRQRRRRRHRAPVEQELDSFLRSHKIKVTHLMQPKEGETAVPRLELTLPEDPEAVQFGDYTATIQYPVEQIADVYYRKFKEPLPDPASRLLDSIKVLEERHLDEFCAVFKRRLLKFRNEAPSLIKRFASSDYIEYIEDSLLDKQNRIFYVYVKNESYQSLGVLEDFSVYKAHSDKPQWTDLRQLCRVHITSPSLFLFRSRIESFISSYYCKNAPDARRYHIQRIEEEFGESVEY